MHRIFALVSILISLSCTAPPQHKITGLPGQPPVNFSQYAGYITVDQANNRNLFYWFVESQNNPATDPVLIWMNGGPGASSLLGLLMENGPFRPNLDGKSLSLYPYSWNRLANIIYLEAPAGVGFSFSGNTNDYNTNDDKTAADNYQFLLNWFEAYPEYQTNDFYVTGESYGGHYVPQLSNLIYEGNKKARATGDFAKIINMKGFAVGNPGTDGDWFYFVNQYAFLTFMFQHALLPENAYFTAWNACGWDKFLQTCWTNFTNPTQQCAKAMGAADSLIPGAIDLYGIYYTPCLTSSSLQYTARWNPIARKFLEKQSRDVNFPNVPNINSKDGDVPFMPCIQDYITTYLNIPDVQKALHVNPTKWQWFGDIQYDENSMLQSMVPLYMKFLSDSTTNWQILVYSGDVDASVPYIGTLRWINCLNLPVVTPWKTWNSSGISAGTVTQFKGLTYVTIKGAGHMVPFYSPVLGYEFFANWLKGSKIQPEN